MPKNIHARQKYTTLEKKRRSTKTRIYLDVVQILKTPRFVVRMGSFEDDEGLISG